MLKQWLFPNDNISNIDELKSQELSINNLIQELELEKTSEYSKNEKNININLITNSNLVEPFKKSNLIKKIEKNKKRSKLEHWNGMKKVNIDDETKDDLMVLRYRNEINKKKNYKNTNKDLPEYFQIGTILDDNEKFSKPKAKKSRILDQFLEEDSNTGYTKTQFKKIQDKKMKNSKNRKWIKLKRAQIKKQGRSLDRGNLNIS